MIDYLTSVRDALSALPGVKSCRIGLEPNLTPDDYPIIRIVPSRVIPGGESFRRKLEFAVFYGVAQYEATDGLEAVYSRLFDWESKIREAVRTGNGYRVEFLDTITDEDALGHFKLFATRFVVEGEG